VTSELKAGWRARIGRVEQICTEADDFPTIPDLDAMLDELRYLPQTPACTALADMLLDMRLDLVIAAAAAGCPPCTVTG
jgi:hypothetical protein